VQKGVTYSADDMSAGMIRFKNNATLMFTTAFSLNTAGSQQGIPDEPVNPAFQAVNIYGTKGGIDLFGKRVIKGMKENVKITPIKPAKNALPSFDAQAREFIRAVRHRDEPLNSTKQAIQLMQMIDALKQSSKTGKSVQIK
jgi:predicted dehydrogenase